MEVEKLFDILIKNLKNKEKGSIWRLEEAGEAFDEFHIMYQTQSQLQTSPTPKDPKNPKKPKKVIYTMKDFSYGQFMTIAQFLPYKDLHEYMKSHAGIYLTLVCLNYFWENKYKLEFRLKLKKEKGKEEEGKEEEGKEEEEEEEIIEFEYPKEHQNPNQPQTPKDLIMPKNYFLDVIGPIMWPELNFDQISHFPKLAAFLAETLWFRKTKYLLNKLFEFNERVKDIEWEIDHESVVGLLTNLSPDDELYTNESFVIGLMKFYEVKHVYPYIEKNRNNINVNILIKAAYLYEPGLFHQRYRLNLLRLIGYTDNPLYKFDRKDFIMKIKFFDLNRFTNAYNYLLGDYDVAKKALDKGVFPIKYITNKRIKNDPEIAWRIVTKFKTGFRLFQYLGDDIRNYNKKIVEYVLSKDGDQIRHCGALIKDDKRLVKIALTENYKAILFASDRLKNKPDFMYWAIASNPDEGRYTLKFINILLKRDPVFLLRVANEFDLVIFDYIDDSLKNNPKFMEEAIRANAREFNILGLEELAELIFADEVINNPYFMYTAITANWLAFELIGDDLIKHKRYVQQLAVDIPMMVAYAPENTRNDPDIMMDLIKRNKNVMRFIGDELKKDPQFLLDLLRNYPSDFIFRTKSIVSNELLANPDFILKAVGINREMIEHIGGDLQLNPDFVLRLLRTYPGEYERFEYYNLFDTTYEFILEAVKINGLLLEYERLYSQPFMFKGVRYHKYFNIVKEAVKQNGLALKHIRKLLEGNREIVRLAVNQNPKALNSATPTIVLEFLKNNWRLAEHLDYAFRNTSWFFLRALKKGVDVRVLLHSSVALRQSPNIMRQAIKINPDARKYVHPSIKDWI